MERRDFLKMLAIGPLLGGALGRGDEEKTVVRLKAPVEDELTALVRNVPVDFEALHRAFMKNAVGSVALHKAPDGGGDYTTRFSGEWKRL